MNCTRRSQIVRTLFQFAATLLVMMGVPDAHASSVSWKFYGGTESEMCFYDETGVIHVQGKHVRVWVKCLSQKELDSVDFQKEKSKKMLEETAQKVARYYIPPISSLENLDADQTMTITAYEVIAEFGTLQPRASMYYELDCKDRMIRELSTYIVSGGKSGYKNKPSNWKFVPPEGNGARLLSLLCTTQ